MINLIDLLNSPGANPTLEQAAAYILLAFVLGQAIAWVYMYTHAGLSYSRGFVQSLVVLTVLLSIGMMVIGNSFAIAFGLIGALSVIRFRNILKDTRDTAFIFASLVIGMACGTGAMGLAVVGTGAFALILCYMYWVGFGSRHTGDGFVRFQFASASGDHAPLQSVLRNYCRSSQLISQRLGEDDVEEFAFRLNMRDVGRASEFTQALRSLSGVSHVTFTVHEDEAEV